MKNLLKKLHMMPNKQTSDVDSEGSSSSSKGNQRLSDLLIDKENKLFTSSSSISGWPPLEDKNEGFDSMSSEALDAAIEAVRAGDSQVQEEYQIQLALELSVREDPEAVQIEAVKQISLGSCSPLDTPAQLLAYRYWNYSALSYDDKILDGFYDLYETATRGDVLSKMPSLMDLQGSPVSDNITWEAVVVNKAADANLLQLEQITLDVINTTRTSESVGQNVVLRLAILVSNHMGGPVGDPDKMLLAWRNFSYKLKATLGSNVLPLGSLKAGMARHRALLFKVLADSVGIPCCLVKGKQYTGSTDVAMNFIKIGDGREYIVDLMADPGTLIPSDTSVVVDHDESSLSSSLWSRDEDTSRLTSSRSGLATSSEECSEFGTQDSTEERSIEVPKKSLPLLPKSIKREKKAGEIPLRPSHHSHARSPSWTEGVSSPAVRKMKVKDVSQYMIDAAKENPQLAQKLHDVLLESGVVAPANLFTEIYNEQESGQSQTHLDQSPFLPIFPSHNKANTSSKSQVHPVQYKTNVPVAAAAAAAAAVVASSMVVAASRRTNDANIELPVAAAATVTAAAVVATGLPNLVDYPRRDGGASGVNDVEMAREVDSVSDRSAGNDSTKSEVSLEDVADCEIAWEDITLGDRIGLGSYGEVYHGDWHGTEVAVKKFLDQEITVDSLEEFKSEVK